jgi:hypothetical protein
VDESAEGPSRQRLPAQEWTHSSGVKVLKVTSNERTTLLAIDRSLTPGFDTFLMERMEALYTAFQEARPRAEGE